ncbi:MAG: hypothetical protein AseanaTS_30130 [Candidatus Pelagadaptatus aseana]|uniref:DUF4124 domain-containing protein n=1 Tax=Candidatus Pelagadaptatus aseana TaxID=3120508 RepID=UPI0039B15CC7
MRPARTLTGTPMKQLMALSLGLLICGEAVSKDFYRWTDENGTTHYSSHPPTDKPSIKVHTSNIKGEPAAPKAIAPSTESQPAGDRDNFDEQANAPADPKVASQNKENCKRAKFNLKTLKEKPRIRVKEGDDYRFIDQNERKEKIKTSQEAVDKYCN